MNAKKEFIETVAHWGTVKCAFIENGDPYWEDEKVTKAGLVEEYSQEEWNKFLEELDFEYDDGFGGQELFGTIWFENGSWATRHEYDGSECWQLCTLPDIPDNLKSKTIKE